MGDTRELSKIFFENVTIIPVDTTTSNIFEEWVENISENRKQGRSTKELEKKIERKLADIYSLSEKDTYLISASEPRWDGEIFDITSRSSLVNS